MVGPPLRLGVEADEECTCLYEESGRVGNQDLDLLHVEEGLHGPGDAGSTGLVYCAGLPIVWERNSLHPSVS